MVHGTVLLVKPAVKYIAKWLLRSLQGFPECAMGASTWFLCVTFYVCLQSLCKKSLTFHKNQKKSHKT